MDGIFQLTDTEPAATRVSLNGMLTIRNIGAARDTLLGALAHSEAVEVDCSAADSIDLSFIQLLIAARLSASSSGRQFTLLRPIGEALRAAVNQGGFTSDAFWSGDA